MLVIVRQDYKILQHIPAYEHLSEASQNLQLEGFGGVGVSVGCVQYPAPFIHVGQTGNFPRYPSLAAS